MTYRRLQSTSEAGALDINYTVVRLNGQIGDLFTEWIEAAYPDRASKVLNQISELHGGKVNDSEWGQRMRGKGQYALMIDELFQKSKSRFFQDKKMPPYNLGAFRRGGNYSLF